MRFFNKEAEQEFLNNPANAAFLATQNMLPTSAAETLPAEQPTVYKTDFVSRLKRGVSDILDGHFNTGDAWTVVGTGVAVVLLAVVGYYFLTKKR
ncbi:MAG: hypothetical protein WBA17_15220 [Saprospiraceae bacterium]